VPQWHTQAQAARLAGDVPRATRLYTQLYSCVAPLSQPDGPTWQAYLDAALFLGAEALRAGDAPQAHSWMTHPVTKPRGDTLLLPFAQLLHNLAALQEATDLPAAERLYLRALKIKLKVLPTEWETTVAQTFNNLAMVCRYQNKLDSAEYYMMRYAGIVMSLKGERSFEAAQAYYSMTNIYLAQQKGKESHEVSTLALEALRGYKAQGDTLALITRLANNHALALLQMAQPEKAMKVIALMLKDLEDLKVAPNADFVHLYTTLGRSMEGQTLYQKALDYYRLAWDTALQVGVPTEHPWLRYNMARMHRLLLEDPKAEALLRQALADPTLTPTQRTDYTRYLAQLLRDTNRPKEAQKLEKRGL
jgi:tetratricopeptide (TPR) repeat protein